MKTSIKKFFRNNLKIVLFLLITLSFILMLLIPVINTEIVIDKSLTISPGVQENPYTSGTVHHTRVLCKSTLIGNVTVKGENIYLTANGYNTQHLKHIYIEDQYRFEINPADDLYIFVFDNTEGQNESLIEFHLLEKWISLMLFVSPAFFITGLIGGAIFFSCLIYFYISILIKKNKLKQKSS